MALGCCAFLTKIARSFIMFTDSNIVDDQEILGWTFKGQDLSWGIATIYFLAFLNQAMGIMSISRLLQWRIECFLFGGCDAVVSSEEQFIMQVYLGSLAEAVWDSEELRLSEKMAVMFQLDDDDLQQLVIEDAVQAKGNLLLQVKNYMIENQHVPWLKNKIAELA